MARVQTKSAASLQTETVELNNARALVESLSDSEAIALTIAQKIWGWGNLSPLDEVFGSFAIIRLALTRASRFGFIACRLGSRLQRYSKETGLWIDAFESVRRNPIVQKEKNTKCAFKEWTEDQKLLGAGRFTELAVFNASQVTDSLSVVYDQCALGLRSSGKLFLADLMLPDDDGAGQFTKAFGFGKDFRSKAEHEREIALAGFEVREEMDLTRDIMAKIRAGLFSIAEMLVETRKLDEPQKRLTRAALGSEIDIWARTALFLESGKIAATGILAVKR